MIGYGCILAMLLLLAFRGTIPRLPSLIDAPLRGLSIIVATAAAVTAALALATGHRPALGQIILLLLLTGSVMFLCGQVSDPWLGDGHIFRVVGWAVSVVALIVPTTLTSLLPVASILMFSLHPRTTVRSRRPSGS